MGMFGYLCRNFAAGSSLKVDAVPGSSFLLPWSAGDQDYRVQKRNTKEVGSKLWWRKVVGAGGWVTRCQNGGMGMGMGMGGVKGPIIDGGSLKKQQVERDSRRGVGCCWTLQSRGAKVTRKFVLCVNDHWWRGDI